MKKINLFSTSIWNSILIVSVVFAAFVLPMLPFEWQRLIVRPVFSIIYISGIFSLEKRSNRLLILFFTTIFLEWFSGILSFEALYVVSRAANVLFFLVIVLLLIRQIASSREVTITVIFSSITGYLLLGLVYSFFVIIIIKMDSGSYSNLPAEIIHQSGGVNTSVPLYYSFVTLASLGYGDICPLKPYTRSLATFIVVTGQFYVGVIVALLVGKFSSKRS